MRRPKPYEKRLRAIEAYIAEGGVFIVPPELQGCLKEIARRYRALKKVGKK